MAVANAGNPIEIAHPTREMVWIEGDEFRMGSDAHYPEEAPAHRVRVAGFFIDPYPVTNRQFAAFVSATGYRTLAERPLNPADYPGALPHMLKPGSLVFRKTRGPVDLHDISNWWGWKPGVYWRHPEGKGSSVAGRLDHPVVQVAFEDAEAYASWAGKSLPTEAEREFAARGGLDGAEFVWGNELTPDGRQMANIWQGEFPWQNLCLDGFERTSPVGVFPPNGYGLFDMAGMSGNGPRIGSAPGMSSMPKAPAVRRTIRVAAQPMPATTQPCPSFVSRARWSRAAPFCARRTTAGATARPRATRK